MSSETRICATILCQMPIVQAKGEDTWAFKRRKSCNRVCADIAMRRKARLKAEAEQEKEKARIDKRREGVLAKNRAKLEAAGCVFTDNER